MSLSGQISNFGGRIPTTTQNIKQFVESSTASQANWVFLRTANPGYNMYITPANKNNSVYINKDLIVNGQILFPSDKKLKEDIEPISHSKIEKLLDLEPVEYKLKTDIKKKKHYGLIAQDIEEIYPELINDNNLGFKSVNYMELIPLILLKMKNMQKEIDELREQLVTMKKDV